MSKPFFEAFDPKTSFFVGVITAILAIGTIGFVVLGGCVMSGNCTVGAEGTTKIADGGTPSAVPTADEAAQVIPSGAIPVVTDSDHLRGNENAKLTIIEYSDYQCPFCERFHPTLQQAMDEYGDDVRWVFRHFPLSFHPEAEPAAEAAECAGDQGKFWEYSDALFEGIDLLGSEFYPQLAETLGLNKADFENCLASDKHLDKIRTQAQEGGAAGVSGTPGTFIITQDGEAIPIRGAQPYSVVKQAIDELL